MLKQEAPSPHKRNSSFGRTKTKLHHKPHASSKLHPPPQGFNDPLYEHLDGEVLNREQHNFGPWVEHDRLKSRERARANANNASSGLPVIYRPQDTSTRYYQQQMELQENNENAGPPMLPSIIRDRNQRAFSLQNLRPASLQFNPSEEPSFARTRVGTKTPFFLRMHGFALPLPKGADSQGSTRKSNFIYNYCFQEADPLKPLLTKLKDLPREKEYYLKLGAGGAVGKGEPSTNELLFRELKQHRMNKLK